jgi:predicted  nucleic acid-binding Zn-ribbon protein
MIYDEDEKFSFKLILKTLEELNDSTKRLGEITIRLDERLKHLETAVTQNTTSIKELSERFATTNVAQAVSQATTKRHEQKWGQVTAIVISVLTLILVAVIELVVK